METIEKTIEVDAPINKVYNQWTQFEEFPKFMEGVQNVRQLDAKHLHWVAQIAGKQKEWDAEIIEQIPDQKISWRSTGGAANSGTVSFQPKADHTRITLRLDYEPEGAMEKAGSVLGLVSSRVEGDLERFQKFIQQQPTETGSWRGEIKGGEVQESQSSSSKSAQAPEYDSSGMSGLK